MGEHQDRFQNPHNDNSIYKLGLQDSPIQGVLSFNFYDYWPFRLTLILFGYATIVVPTYLLIRWVKKKYSENSFDFSSNFFRRFLKLFAIGTPEASLSAILSEGKHDESKSLVNTRPASKNRNWLTRDGPILAFYFAGIQLNFVSMGFFQERIVTIGYPRVDNEFIIEPFGDAQFLVLVNRIVALVFCCLYFIHDYRNQPVHVPPLFKHSFCSLSNTLSSWCQYEALKFVSFPVMTVCKASKLIPTMFMGRIIRGKSYSTRDYLTAIILVIGACSFFLSNQGDSKKGSSVTTVSGIILMAGYLAFDSFTPNWQRKLFDCKPQVSKTQMMLGVNTFSAILCFGSLLEQGTLFSSIEYALSHDGFSRDLFLLSLSGACGQVFIYAIIKRFGPEVLAVIMTLRQIFSIVLSSLYFSHPLSITGIIGLLLVFGAIFYSKYSELKEKNNKVTAR